MKLRLWGALFLVPLFAFTCGNRRPFVYNSLCEPIDVRVTWQDGTESRGPLNPSTKSSLSDPPHYPKKVTITLPDGKEHVFTSENAPGLVGGEVTGPVSGWRATEAGVVPLLEEEILDRDNRLKPNCTGSGVSPSGKSHRSKDYDASRERRRAPDIGLAVQPKTQPSNHC